MAPGDAALISVPAPGGPGRSRLSLGALPSSRTPKTKWSERGFGCTFEPVLGVGLSHYARLEAAKQSTLEEENWGAMVVVGAVMVGAFLVGWWSFERIRFQVAPVLSLGQCRNAGIELQSCWSRKYRLVM